MQAPRKWSRPALAAKATAGEAFVAHMRATLEQIGANVAGAAAGRNPEYLHQLRVGVRRLRAALRAFRELLRRRRADAVEQPWRAMMVTLGGARDWDVFRQSLEAGELRAAAGRRRAESQQHVRALLLSPQFREALRRTSAWARSPPWRRHADRAEPLRQFARPALQRLHKGLRKAADGIDWRDASSRHKLRIRVKRMRYGCDYLAQAFPERKTAAFLEELHRLQDILGEMNDLAVQRGFLEGLPRSKGTALTQAKLTARQRVLAAGLRRAWKAFRQLRPFW